MTVDLWIEIYVKLIKAGRKTLSDVPDEYRDKVKDMLEKDDINTEN